MRIRIRRAYRFVAILAVVLLGVGLPLAGVLAGRRVRGLAPTSTAAPAPDATNPEAARLNSIGVAYMGQQRFAEAQKQFEAALKAEPDYALAKLNLGVALLAQPKSEEAKAALLDATQNLPRDPYGWCNLRIAYKDSSES